MKRWTLHMFLWLLPLRIQLVSTIIITLSTLLLLLLMLPHAISDFFLEFNSYQKIFSIRYEFKTNWHHTQLTNIDPSDVVENWTSILIAIKNKRLILQDTGSTEYIAKNNFNPLLLNNSPTNPKIDFYSIYLILNNVWPSVNCVVSVKSHGCTAEGGALLM